MGDRVYVYMPAERLGKAYKFARPFKGPYRILTMFDNGAEVKLIEKLQTHPIRVALNRVRRCPHEIPISDKPRTNERGKDCDELEPVSPKSIPPEPVTDDSAPVVKPPSSSHTN